MPSAAQLAQPRTGRTSSLTSIQLAEIQSLSIAGVPDTEICARYPISPANLRRRRSDGEWPTPSRLQHLARIAQRAASGAAAGRPPPHQPSHSSRDPENGVSNGKTACEITLEAAKTTVIGCFAGAASAKAGLLAAATLSAPTDWKEFGQAARALGYMVGHNTKATQNTQINVLVWPKGGQESGWMEEGGPIVESGQ